jgi:general secretion pathway protein K
MIVSGRKWLYGLEAQKMAPNRKHRNNPHQLGMALIAVLWITAALSLLAMSLSQMARTDVRVVSVFKQGVAAQALADGALNVACAWLAQNLATVSGYKTIPALVGGESLNVKAVSSVGFININAASPEFIRDMLIYGAGLNGVEADRLAANIVQWRSLPTPLTNLAEEARLYRQAGLSPPRHAPFIMPQDLRQVLGVTPDIYAKIAPLIDTSAQIKYGFVDPSIAPFLVLRVLAKGNDQVAQQVIQTRGQQPLAPIFSPAQYPGLTPQFIGRAGGFIFHLRVLVPSGDGQFWLRTWWVDFSATPLGGIPWKVTLKEPLRAVRNGDQF